LQLNKRTIVSLDELDSFRFARTLIRPSDQCLYIEQVKSWFQIPKLIHNSIGTLIVLGARPPDKAAVHHLGAKADRIIILQHAVNRRRKVKELSLQYFLMNFRKIFYWSVFIIVCKLLPRNKLPPVHLYYFTDNYLNEWTEILGKENFEATSCPAPDPTRFGSKNDILINDTPVSYQLIDEPFTKTLGISVKSERILLQKILEISGDEPIMVKIHPRSQSEKYAFSKKFILSECIYSNPGAVIGYKSGLLNYNFCTKKYLCIHYENEKFKIQTSMKKQKNKNKLTYLDVVNEEIK
jgi:hypothetical protein